MKTGTRWAVLGLVVVVAVVAFVVAQSGGGSIGSSNTTQTQAPAPAPRVIVVRNAKPVGGVAAITVKKGDQVRLTVQSDSAQEIHVHGYDVHKIVPKNGSVSFNFPAKIDGGFVIELEKPGVQIAALKVQP
jgi:FtsP/CotA-like multicopper oxidase with cupredoxin domain